jgi:hypothetical protein
VAKLRFGDLGILADLDGKIDNREKNAQGGNKLRQYDQCP